MRPCRVSKPTRTLKSGAGRIPSAGAVRLRVAISTRASARRWPEVRASSSMRPGRPRRSLASAQSASKRSCSRRLSSSATMAPLMRVERHLAQPHAVEARGQEDVTRGLLLLVRGLGPVGVGQLLPIGQYPGEVLKAQLFGLGHQHLFVAGHGGLGAVPAGPGDGLGLILADLPIAPGLGHRGQVAQGPAQAHPALGAGPGDPTREEIHDAAVLAPSAAHCSPASKAAVASVMKDVERADNDAASPSTRRRRSAQPQRRSVPRVPRRSSPTPCARCKHGVVTRQRRQIPAEMADISPQPPTVLGAKCEVRSAKCEVRSAKCEVPSAQCKHRPVALGREGATAGRSRKSARRCTTQSRPAGKARPTRSRGSRCDRGPNRPRPS